MGAKHIPVTQCGSWVRTSNGGHFASPNFPNTYPPNKECVYILEGGCNVSLSLLKCYIPVCSHVRFIECIDLIFLIDPQNVSTCQKLYLPHQGRLHSFGLCMLVGVPFITL